ncbi:hypothetical protein D3C72_522170 [compost metagenome]
MTHEPLIGRVPVTLNPDGVAAPIHRSIRLAAEALAVCLPATEAYDFTQPFDLGPAMHRLRFEPVADIEGRRSELSAWILAQAIGEVARGLRASLEEAYLYAVVATGLPCEIDQLQPMIDGARSDANVWNNPVLLDRLGELLTEPLVFADELASLQRLRNCLEHRSGVVSVRDTAGGGRLVLTLPRLAIMHRLNGEQVELGHGELVAEGGGWVARAKRETTYGLGERIAFTSDQLGEVLIGCHFLAADLIARLPVPAEENPENV